MGLDSITWNFFATSHGKGPCDSLGGAVKRMARQAVLSRRVKVQSAAQMKMAIQTENIEILVLNDVNKVFEDSSFPEIMNAAKKVMCSDAIFRFIYM